jgi:hypothetical protein
MSDNGSSVNYTHLHSQAIPSSQEPSRVPISIDIKCAKCGSPLRLIALIKTREVIEKILVAMHLPADVPELHPARPPPRAEREARDREDQLNESTRHAGTLGRACWG